jgi:hypothetical protein
MAYKFQKGHADMSGSLTQLGAIIVSGTLSASAAIDGLSLKIGTTEVISSARELKSIATIDASSQQVIEDYMIELNALTSFGNAGVEVENPGSLDVAQGLKVANSAVITDALELSNIASLDATTEATVENAIDTLSNLSSAGKSGVDLDVLGPLDLAEGLKQNGTVVLTDAGALQNLASMSASSDIAGGQLNVRGVVSGAIATATYMTASGHVSASFFFGNGAGLKGISSDTVDTTTQASDAVYYVPFVDQATGQDGETLYIQDSLQLNPSDDSVVVLGAFQGGSLKGANLTSGRLPLVGAGGSVTDNALFVYNTTRTGDEPNVSISVSSSASGSAALGDGVLFVTDANDNDIFFAMSGGMEFYADPTGRANQKLEISADTFFYGDKTVSKGLFVDLDSNAVGVMSGVDFQAQGASEFAGTADFNGVLKSNNKLVASGMISGSAGLALSGAVNLQGDVKLGLSGVGTEVRGDMTVQQQATFNSEIKSNNKLVATGMISGSAGLALSGAVNLPGDVKLAATGVGTSVRGDLNVAQAATFQDEIKIQNSKYLTLNGGSSHIFLNGANCLITGSGGISLSSSLNMGGNATFGGNVVSDGFGQFAGKITANSVDSTIAASAASLATADSIYFADADDSDFVKKVSMANMGGYLAGGGLVADGTTGVISLTSFAAPNAIGDADATMTAGVNWGNATLTATREWTLPASADADVGDRVLVKAPECGAFHIRIKPNTAQNIDGSTAELNLEADFAAVELVYVAANNWRAV